MSAKFVSLHVSSRYAAAFVTLLACNSILPAQTPIGTSFTYQGRLLLSGMPVNDEDGDFEFRLYTAEVDGSQLGGVVTVETPIQDGLFSVELDFGASFTGDSRWISVTYTDSASTSTTFPRQELTPAPHSLFAKQSAISLSAGWAEESDYADEAGMASIAGWADSADIWNGATSLKALAYKDKVNNDYWLTTTGKQLSVANGGTGATSLTSNYVLLGQGTSPITTASGLYYSSGKLGIGTTAPVGQLHIKSTSAQIRLSDNYENKGSAIQSITATGSALVTLANAYSGAGNYAFLDSTQPAWGSALDGTSTQDCFKVLRAPASASISWESKLKVNKYGQLFLIENNGAYTMENPQSWEACFRVLNGAVRLKDSAHNDTQLSTHPDPREIQPSAVTSFADEAVALPWSFRHENDLVGKGSVVDMAKAMKWIETKMQAELGKNQGQVFFDYDLPAAEVISIDAYLEELVDRTIEKKLEETPWVEVALKVGESLPADSWEEVEIVNIEEKEVVTKVKKINWETATLEEVSETQIVREETKTGKTERRLKSNYRFDDGKLFKKAEIAEMALSVSDIPPLPDWIMQRIPTEKHQSIEELIQDQLSLGIERAWTRELASRTPLPSSESEARETALLGRTNP